MTNAFLSKTQGTPNCTTCGNATSRAGTCEWPHCERQVEEFEEAMKTMVGAARHVIRGWKELDESKVDGMEYFADDLAVQAVRMLEEAIEWTLNCELPKPGAKWRKALKEIVEHFSEMAGL